MSTEPKALSGVASDNKLHSPNNIPAGTKLEISPYIDLFIKKANEGEGIKPGKDFQDWAKNNPDKALQKHKNEGGLNPDKKPLDYVA